MDDMAGEETKALRPTATSEGSTSTLASAPAVEQQPAPLPAADCVSVAAKSTSSGGTAVESCGEEDDDEQVERFYALLANIRALRGLYGAGEDRGGSGSPAAGGRGRKRAREAAEAQAPWRPAFRMEDFEDVAADARKTGAQNQQ